MYDVVDSKMVVVVPCTLSARLQTLWAELAVVRHVYEWQYDVPQMLDMPYLLYDSNIDTDFLYAVLISPIIAIKSVPDI